MNHELLKKAQDCLSIRNVYLHSTEVTTSEDFSPYNLPDSAEAQFKNYDMDCSVFEAKDENGESVQLLRYRYVAAFRLVPNQETDDSEIKDSDEQNIKVLAEASATFAAIYELKCELDEDAIEEFGHFNVGYHVWPYWREYASSIVSRMQLPQFVIPMYRIPAE